LRLWRQVRCIKSRDGDDLVHNPFPPAPPCCCGKRFAVISRTKMPRPRSSQNGALTCVFADAQIVLIRAPTIQEWCFVVRGERQTM
jgi:hypothetical protein